MGKLKFSLVLNNCIKYFSCLLSIYFCCFARMLKIKCVTLPQLKHIDRGSQAFFQLLFNTAKFIMISKISICNLLSRMPQFSSFLSVVCLIHLTKPSRRLAYVYCNLRGQTKEAARRLLRLRRQAVKKH